MDRIEAFFQVVGDILRAILSFIGWILGGIVKLIFRFIADVVRGVYGNLVKYVSWLIFLSIISYVLYIFK